MSDGYVTDKNLNDGDLVFQGPLVMKTGKMTGRLFTGAIGKTVEVHQWHSALPVLAKWLNETPDALNVLINLIVDGVDDATQDADVWDGIRPDRVALDRLEIEHGGKLIAELEALS